MADSAPTCTLANGETFTIGTTLLVNGVAATVETIAPECVGDSAYFVTYVGHPVPCYVGRNDETVTVVR